jgi:CPA1 family monovalent cation:H+ antiporter
VLFRAARRGKTIAKPSWRLVAATSLAGVRGTITLAGVMTLPLAMDDGSPFPARDLAILLAAGVIIVSLVAASVALPRLLNNLSLPPEPSNQEEEDGARTAAAEAAIRAIEQAQHKMGEGRADADLYIDAGARIMELYRQRIDGRAKTGDERELARRIDDIERKLRLAGLKAERDEIYRKARSRRLSDDAARKLVREIDLLEARFGAST